MPHAWLYQIDTTGVAGKKPIKDAKKEGIGKNLCAEQQLLAKLNKEAAQYSRWLMVVDAWPCGECIDAFKKASHKFTIFVRATNGKLTDGEYATNHLEDITRDSADKIQPVTTKKKKFSASTKELRSAEFKSGASSSSPAASSSSTVSAVSISPATASSSSSPPVNLKYSLLQKVLDTDGKEAGAIIIYQYGNAQYVPYADICELRSKAEINSLHKIKVEDYLSRLPLDE